LKLSSTRWLAIDQISGRLAGYVNAGKQKKADKLKRNKMQKIIKMLNDDETEDYFIF